MLAKLKREVKLLGITQVSANLGYRSTRTIQKWLKDKRIPACALPKLKTYFVS